MCSKFKPKIESFLQDIQRLHIVLFNLTVGQTIINKTTSQPFPAKKKVGKKNHESGRNLIK